MKVKDLLRHYSDIPSYDQVVEVDLIDRHTGEVIFKRMRVEAFWNLVSPDLELTEFWVTSGKPYATTYQEAVQGHKRQRIILHIVAPIYEGVEPYYSDEEWKLIRRGELKV